MAAPTQGPSRPGRTLAVLGLIVVALGVWTFWPGLTNTPKLGLDLRGRHPGHPDAELRRLRGRGDRRPAQAGRRDHPPARRRLRRRGVRGHDPGQRAERQHHRVDPRGDQPGDPRLAGHHREARLPPRAQHRLRRPATDAHARPGARRASPSASASGERGSVPVGERLGQRCRRDRGSASRCRHREPLAVGQPEPVGDGTGHRRRSSRRSRRRPTTRRCRPRSSRSTAPRRAPPRAARPTRRSTSPPAPPTVR